MFYCHWLIEKLFWLMAGQNVARQKSQTKYKEKEGRTREMPAVTREEDIR